MAGPEVAAPEGAIHVASLPPSVRRSPRPPPALLSRLRRPDQRTPAAPGVADLSARVSAYLANVSRMRGDVQEAQRRFYYARYLIKHEAVADPRVFAEVDSCEAAFFLDLRRFTEAEELLARSITLYTIVGEKAETARPLLTLGLVHYHRGNYAKAIEATQEATHLLSEEADPRIYLSARHNLALYHCEAGNYHAASEALQQDRHLYARFPDAWTQLRLVWLEGKIAHGLGDLTAKPWPPSSSSRKPPARSPSPWRSSGTSRST